MLPSPEKNKGFTLIELVMVLVILGILAALALPKFSDLSSSAKSSSIESIAGTIRATIGIIRSKAYVQGLSVSAADPGDQSAYLVTTEAGTSEVDWRNLCPESVAELGDTLDMPDHIGLSETSGLTSNIDNRYTIVGYDLVIGPPPPLGCYVVYDSFGNPDCTVTTVTNDC